MNSFENEKLFGSRIACGNTAYNRSKSDAYPTPPEVTVALLDFLKLKSGTRIWEAMCLYLSGDLAKLCEDRQADAI